MMAAAPSHDAGGRSLPVVRRRGRPRDPQADVRILESAAKLILARGYDAMTIDDVAANAHVGKATVYRRWARKEDLAVAAMERIYSSKIPVPDTGSLRDDLIAGFTATLTFANSAVGAAYLRTAIAESVRDPRISALYRTAIEQAERAARTVYQRAIERGELDPGIDPTWGERFLGGVLAACVVTGRPVPRVDEAPELVDLLLSGLTGRRPVPA